MDITENLKLNKPLITDNYNLDIQNENWDKIDVLAGSFSGLIESGTNYIKFSEGTLIVWGSSNLRGANRANPKKIMYPVTFINTPSVAPIGVRSAPDDIGSGLKIHQIEKGFFQLSHESTDIAGVDCSYIAIGRWK